MRLARIRQSGNRRLVAVVHRALGAMAALGLLVSAFGFRQERPDRAAPDAPAAVPAARQANNVAVITIHGPITEWTARSVERRLELAQRAGAGAVVFEINTPGGEVRAVLTISKMIKRSPIPNTVAWIRPDAYSGGAIIALACRELITSDPAAMGDAIPIALNPFTGLQPMPEAERQKLLAPLIADLVDSARRRGYDEKLVQGIAALGVELWLVRHRQTGQRLFIDRAEHEILFGPPPSGEMPRMPSSPPAEADGAGAPGLPEPLPGWLGLAPPARRPPTKDVDPSLRFRPAAPSLAPIAGDVSLEQDVPSERPVLTEADRGQWEKVEKVSEGAGPLVFGADEMLRYGLAAAVVQNDEELRAFFGANHLLRLDASWSEGLVAFLTLWPVRGLLVVVFIISLFLEMSSPGMVLPGAVAMVALVLLLAPPMLINLASWWEVAAIALGVLLIVLEIFVIPGFGVLGVAGFLLLFGGMVGTFVPEGGFFPDTPSQRNDLLYGVVSVVLAVATSGVAIYFLSRHFASLPVLNRLVLKDPEPVEGDGDELLAAIGPGPDGPVEVGAIGVAVTPLRPSGNAEFGDRLVDVVSDFGYIPAGATVRVTSVSEFRTAVEQVAPPPTIDPAPGGPLGST